MESNFGSVLFFTISLIVYLVAAISYILYAALKNEKIAKSATWLLAVALVAHTIALVFRTIEVKHAPFVTTYESMAFWAWLIALAYLVLQSRLRIKTLGALITPLAFLALAAASLLPEGYKQSKALMPALQSRWLEFHIATCFIGYACFAVSFIAGVAYLINRKRLAVSSIILLFVFVLSGTMYLVKKVDVLFSVTGEGQSALDNAAALAGLRQEFGYNGISLSDHAAVSLKKEYVEWLITDEDTTYTVKKRRESKLDIYRTASKSIGIVSLISIAFLAASFIAGVACLINRKRLLVSFLILLFVLALSGTIYLVRKVDALFSVTEETRSMGETQSALDNGAVPAGLRQEFGHNGISLSDHAAVSVEKMYAEWLIADEDTTYTVKKRRESKLDIYRTANSFIGIVSLISIAFLALLVITYLVDRTDVLKDKMDEIGYKAISVGFPFLTLGIISGAMWANVSWGAYWQWDPKETWSLITWFIYAIYLHLRVVAKWKGKYGAIVSVIGFAAVVFTFFGVNYLLSGLHSYG